MEREIAAAAIFGPDQPGRFLTASFGSPARDAPEWVADDLPATLVEWHRQAARWDSPIMRQNSVPFQRTMDEDVLLVGIENQSVSLDQGRDDRMDNDQFPGSYTARRFTAATTSHGIGTRAPCEGG